MRRKLFRALNRFVPVVIVLGIFVWALWPQDLELPGFGGDGPPAEAAGEDGESGESDDAPAMLTPPDEPSFTGTMSHIHDGDTVFVVADNPADFDGTARPKIRLLRIEAPELDPSRAKDQELGDCNGEAARAHLEDLAPEGTRIIGWFDVEARDQYGRPLAHLWTEDGVWLNGAMLRDGYANVVTFHPNNAHDDEVRALQRHAHDNDAGLWGQSCAG